jgi:hypothetical protein
MTCIPEQAVEAAARALTPFLSWDNRKPPGEWKKRALHDARVAVTAALPHLLPAPSQSDMERAHGIAGRWYSPLLSFQVDELTNQILTFAAAVRAEATLAEREACAKVADAELKKWPGMSVAAAIAAAIRGRKP